MIDDMFCTFAKIYIKIYLLWINCLD